MKGDKPRSAKAERRLSRIQIRTDSGRWYYHCPCCRWTSTDYERPYAWRFAELHLQVAHQK